MFDTTPGLGSSPLVVGLTQTQLDQVLNWDFVPPDTDGDGVLDYDDVRPATAIPEGVPTVELKPNHWALVDGDFDTVSKGKGKGPGRSYTIEDTAGCSCEQIIDELALGKGHEKFGCSISAMDEWVGLVNDQ